MPIQFSFSAEPFTKTCLGMDTPLIVYGFKDEKDCPIAELFPEYEEKRLSNDRKGEKEDEAIYPFIISRARKLALLVFVHINDSWRGSARKLVKKKRKPVLDSRRASGIPKDFLFNSELRRQTNFAIRHIREQNKENYEKIFFFIPSEFCPGISRGKKRPMIRERLTHFVRTIVESLYYEHGLVERRKERSASIKEVVFCYSGEKNAHTESLVLRSCDAVASFGKVLANTRTLIELPPNEKNNPCAFVSSILQTKEINTEPASSWENITSSPVFSSRVRVQYLAGKENIRRYGFGGVYAVGKGSAYHPCVLKLAYKPKKQPNNKSIKKLVLVGKGVTYDTGGYDLKLEYEKMHYDMAGAATVFGLVLLADTYRLPVEITALIPFVHNALGPDSSHDEEIATLFGGTTVRFTSTDAEGRVIMADMFRYAELEIEDFSCLIEVCTLTQISDLLPDAVFAMIHPSLEKKLRNAEYNSCEKVFLSPPIEYFRLVSSQFLDNIADYKNSIDQCHYAGGALFLDHFLEFESSRWAHFDLAVIMENDAPSYGAGPGFGLRLLWEFIKQFKK